MSVKRYRVSYQHGVIEEDGSPRSPMDSEPMVLATDYAAQSLELQAVREALRQMLEHAPSMDGRVVDQARAALKPSRGA